MKLGLTEAEEMKMASIKELENSQSIQNSLQYEFDLAKNVKQLIHSLDEARDETKTTILNDKVTTLTAQLTAAETVRILFNLKIDIV